MRHFLPILLFIVFIFGVTIFKTINYKTQKRTDETGNVEKKISTTLVEDQNKTLKQKFKELYR